MRNGVASSLPRNRDSRINRPYRCHMLRRASPYYGQRVLSQHLWHASGSISRAGAKGCYICATKARRVIQFAPRVVPAATATPTDLKETKTAILGSATAKRQAAQVARVACRHVEATTLQSRGFPDCV